MNGVTGLILAGGQGSRMGGADKGLVEWQGRPLVSHVIARLAPQVDRMAISANRNIDVYARYGLPVLPDLIPGFAGPLAGLHAGLSACATPWLATCPCDAPCLPGELVEPLLTAAAAANATIAVARVAGKLEPAFMICRRQALASLESYLAGGERRIRHWLAANQAIAVDFPEKRCFANFNTPEDMIAPAELNSTSAGRH